MAKDAAYNLHLSSAEAKLLSYYADCATGFRPARAEINKRTGIQLGTISGARLGLARHGIIAYDKGKNQVTLYWERIRAFAMMDKRFTKHEALRGTYSLPGIKGRWRLKVGQLVDRYWDSDAIHWNLNPGMLPKNALRPLSEGELEFAKFACSLTESQFYALFYPDLTREDRLRMIPDRNLIEKEDEYTPEIGIFVAWEDAVSCDGFTPADSGA